VVAGAAAQWLRAASLAPLRVGKDREAAKVAVTARQSKGYRRNRRPTCSVGADPSSNHVWHDFSKCTCAGTCSILLCFVWQCYEVTSMLRVIIVLLISTRTSREAGYLQRQR
jgi:hypothetical protein